ncbi:hypothetical protein EDI_084580 [Entamoeba dispar SAW760]|uniref:Leucine rich repeat containing protein BspA family protein n=1 Tax=Entamoeba dispar (strain ATCC PRA-260 / SAW760) TaxID=370354 RepID=B0EV58_ENTDS|nr:uncharacterized protein EDI_084580 [Entamoeba dispar SAW760]EDR21588.1 hypothetical protein EDI_084580 [Entamoeba dispar SAW760]|eukprot:EDR21588.1 hypothetical protein EDI_084580 [Entamoeba dispar SAW760]
MKLGYNEIMITSMYFNDIKDFINLEIGVKRFQGNIERFHFNPIPLNEYSRKLFTNIETFHIYNKKDKTFNDGKIFKQVIWYPVNYSKYLKEKEAWNECKNIKYTYQDRNKYGNIIPLEVKSLGYKCFEYCNSLTTINIPSSISKIGDCCFSYCSSLKSINIPSSIIKIGDGCFYKCISLTSMNIPSSIIKIGDECFYECSSLISINIPSSISELGDRCFEECSSLTSINIPSPVISIGHWCFRECSSLTSMNIDNLQFISEDRIFMNEPVLVSVQIPENLQIINGKNIEKKDINKFIIPSSITKLGNYCFNGCYSLKSINIPSTINELGDCCFSYCSSLQSINIPSSISKLGDECFYLCTSLKSINIPSSIISFGDGCFYGCGCEDELMKNKRIPRKCFKWW